MNISRANIVITHTTVEDLPQEFDIPVAELIVSNDLRLPKMTKELQDLFDQAIKLLLPYKNK